MGLPFLSPRVRRNALPGQGLAAAPFSYCFPGRSCCLQAGRHRWTGNILLTALFMATVRLSRRVSCKQLNPYNHSMVYNVMFM